MNIRQKNYKIVLLVLSIVLIAVFAFSCGEAKETDSTRVITDDAGREVSVPAVKNIKKVFFTSGLAQIYITSLAPELMGATSSEYMKEELEFLPEGLSDLPVLGKLNGNENIDKESLLKENIDIIFSISGVPLTEENIDEAIVIEKQTSIPCVLVDGSFDKIPDAFKLLGDILGKEDRANELAEYCDNSFKTVENIVKDIPENEKKSLYYALGPTGLQTESADSQHMVAFLKAGAKSCLEGDKTFTDGMSDVSLEQVIKWNPEVIISIGDEFGGGYSEILKNSEWKNIQAVKNSQVYAMPGLPFSWCDRPPGVNRLIGLHWVLNLLYPDLYDIDIKDYAKDFFKTFYGTEISDATMDKILKNSLRK